MLDHCLEKSASLQIFSDLVSQKKSILLESLTDAQKALLASYIFKISNKNVVFITSSSHEDTIFDNLCFFQEKEPLEFIALETFFDDKIAQNPDITGQRLNVLYELHKKTKPSFVLTSIAALLQKTITKDVVDKQFFFWKKGEKIDFNSLSSFFSDLGYKQTSLVSDKNEFAMRGGIVDIFVPSSQKPYRIEFFGDEIDQIRTFDPGNQKSIEKIEKIQIVRADEKQEQTASLLDHLGEDTIILFDDIAKMEDQIVELEKFSSKKNMFSFTSFFKENCKTFQKIYSSSHPIEELCPNAIFEKKQNFFQNVTFDVFKEKIDATRFFHNFYSLSEYLHIEKLDPEIFFIKPSVFPKQSDITCVFSTNKELENFKTKVKETKIELPQNFQYNKGRLSSSFALSDISKIYLSYDELLSRKVIRRQKWRSSHHTPTAEFHHLEVGDLVVHYHSGIGQYLGMEKQKNHLGQVVEFLAIAYAEKSKLLVPLSQAHLVSRYIGSKEESPSLSTLGSKKWQLTKQKAQKQIIGYAAQLLDLYAIRSQEEGFACPKDTEEMQLFELDFPYTETEDQLKAISDIKNDMMLKKPMERLICGDVGYGKTEVAMRAAFKAVVDGKKQVAVLVPTTVLAMQHFETFSQRMGDYPIIIDVVSRFRSAKENKEIIQKASLGKIDILIGTHRLISKDVQFKNLGLIIIDEEQRFGVRAKEHLKKLKKSVDSISLSATPIPRSLYMSLIQAREMSTISTPPQDRLPIQTILIENDDDLIKQAIQRELAREGQIFIIHNRVESIYQRAKHIQKLLPKTSISIVHGQMDTDSIDEAFHGFKKGDIDILVSTTILENGVDIPNANTIIIDHAHHFGLSDLYQLKGRVGRWNRRAFAYLVVPKNRELSEISRKRLNALLESGGYGGGMKIALRDLEIRGAGDILGEKQSGQVASIGFHLYCQLLTRAVKSLKEKKPISFNETKMEFSYPAYLPEDYIKETNLRMEIYHRLGAANTFSELEKIYQEMIDRYGKPPEAVIWLYHLSRIRCFACVNQFSLLKFAKLTLLAEQKLGKKKIQKTILLPQKIPSAEFLELFVLERLSQYFVCKNRP